MFIIALTMTSMITAGSWFQVGDFFGVCVLPLPVAATVRRKWLHRSSILSWGNTVSL